MRLVVHYIIAFIALLLLGSCAQVGKVSGGEKDVFAPQLVSYKCSPNNESVNYNGKTIELVFDEYFKLKNPRNNIKIVPSHATLKTEIKKKSLMLSWEEELKANTTYAIYFNNAVADITEGNDSIMQFVFATGPEIDSIEYRVSIIDAWSLKPKANCVVALLDTMSNEVMNFTETNRYGMAQLNYVPVGNYRLVAFMDENKDLVVQDDEAIGFSVNPDVRINESFVDTVPIKLFSPDPVGQPFSVSALSKNKLSVSSKNNISAGKWFVNDELVSPSKIRPCSSDSLILLLKEDLSKRNIIVYQNNGTSDTVSVVYKPLNDNAQFTLTPLNKGSFHSGQELLFEANSMLDQIDLSQIKLLNKKDSTWLKEFTIKHEFDILSLWINPESFGEFELVIEEGGVVSEHSKNTALSVPFKIREDKTYGSLILDVSRYTSAISILIFQNGRVVREVASNNEENVRVGFLNPGDYTFKVVVDKNENESWDVGNYLTLTQPEEVHNYSTKTKLRANWEATVSLDPNIVKN